MPAWKYLVFAVVDVFGDIGLVQLTFVHCFAAEKLNLFHFHRGFEILFGYQEEVNEWPCWNT